MKGDKSGYRKGEAMIAEGLRAGLDEFDGLSQDSVKDDGGLSERDREKDKKNTTDMILMITDKTG